MKKVLLLSILFVNIHSAFCQNAYYDAIYYATAKCELLALDSTLKKNGYKNVETYNLLQSDTVLLKKLTKFLHEPIKNAPPDIEEVKRMLGRYNVNSDKAFTSSFLSVAGILTPLTSIISSLSPAQADTVLNGLSLFLVDKFRATHKATVLQMFNQSIGKYEDLKYIFPKTFDEVIERDWANLNGLGSDFKTTVRADFKNAVDSVFGMIENPEKFTGKDVKTLLFRPEKSKEFLKSPLYVPLKVNYGISKQIANGLHPVEAMKVFIDEAEPTWLADRSAKVNYLNFEQILNDLEKIDSVHLQVNLFYLDKFEKLIIEKEDCLKKVLVDQQSGLNELQKKKLAEELTLHQTKHNQEKQSITKKYGNVMPFLKSDSVKVVLDRNKILNKMEDDFKINELNITNEFLLKNKTQEIYSANKRIVEKYQKDKNDLENELALIAKFRSEATNEAKSNLRIDNSYYKNVKGVLKKIYLLQKNLRDTTKTTSKSLSGAWVSYAEIEKLDKMDEKLYFLALLMHQDTVAMASMVPGLSNVDVKDTDDIKRKYDRLYSSFISPFIKTVLVSSAAAVKNTTEQAYGETLSGIKLYYDLVSVFNKENEVSVLDAKLISYISNLANMFNTANISSFTSDLAGILGYLSSKNDPEANVLIQKAMNRVSNVTSFSSAVVQSKTSSDVNNILKEFSKVDFTARRKYAGTLSLSSTPGLNVFMVKDYKAQYGLSVPIGLDLSFRCQGKGYFHVNYNELDLTRFFNKGLNNIKDDSTKFSLNSIFSRELALGWSFEKIPIVIQVGHRWATPIGVLTKKENHSETLLRAIDRGLDKGFFIRIGYDLPIFNIIKWYGRN